VIAVILVILLSLILVIMFSALRAASIADEEMELAYAEWASAHPDKANPEKQHDSCS